MTKKKHNTSKTGRPDSPASKASSKASSPSSKPSVNANTGNPGLSPSSQALLPILVVADASEGSHSPHATSSLYHDASVVSPFSEGMVSAEGDHSPSAGDFRGGGVAPWSGMPLEDAEKVNTQLRQEQHPPPRSPTLSAGAKTCKEGGASSLSSAGPERTFMTVPDGARTRPSDSSPAGFSGHGRMKKLAEDDAMARETLTGHDAKNNTAKVSNTSISSGANGRTDSKASGANGRTDSKATWANEKIVTKNGGSRATANALRATESDSDSDDDIHRSQVAVVNQHRKKDKHGVAPTADLSAGSVLGELAKILGEKTTTGDAVTPGVRVVPGTYAGHDPAAAYSAKDKNVYDNTNAAKAFEPINYSDVGGDSAHHTGQSTLSTVPHLGGQYLGQTAAVAAAHRRAYSGGDYETVFSDQGIVFVNKFTGETYNQFELPSALGKGLSREVLSGTSRNGPYVSGLYSRSPDPMDKLASAQVSGIFGNGVETVPPSTRPSGHPGTDTIPSVSGSNTAGKSALGSSRPSGGPSHSGSVDSSQQHALHHAMSPHGAPSGITLPPGSLSNSYGAIAKGSAVAELPAPSPLAADIPGAVVKSDPTPTSSNHRSGSRPGSVLGSTHQPGSQPGSEVGSRSQSATNSGSQPSSGTQGTPSRSGSGVVQTPSRPASGHNYTPTGSSLGAGLSSAISLQLTPGAPPAPTVHAAAHNHSAAAGHSAKGTYAPFGKSHRTSTGKSGISGEAYLEENLDKLREMIIEEPLEIITRCTDMYGSRRIQDLLTHLAATDAQGLLLFEELLSKNVIALSKDVFANYVIQRLIEIGHYFPMMSSIIAAGEVNAMSTHKYGCRVVQRLLTAGDEEMNYELYKQLKGKVPELVLDQNGNHVIQKLFENEKAATEIIEELKGQMVVSCRHVYGCRVVQRMCEVFRTKIQVLFDEICTDESLDTLCYDKYGNYVLQYVLTFGKKRHQKAILDKVKRSITSFSCHKFASNISEKVIDSYSKDPEVIREVVEAALKGKPLTRDGDDLICRITKDQFGNYIIQKLVDILGDDSPPLKLLVERLAQNYERVKKSQYGMHILALLAKKGLITGEMRDAIKGELKGKSASAGKRGKNKNTDSYGKNEDASLNYSSPGGKKGKTDEAGKEKEYKGGNHDNTGGKYDTAGGKVEKGKGKGKSSEKAGNKGKDRKGKTGGKVCPDLWGQLWQGAGAAPGGAIDPWGITERAAWGVGVGEWSTTADWSGTDWSPGGEWSMEATDWIQYAWPFHEDYAYLMYQQQNEGWVYNQPF